MADNVRRLHVAVLERFGRAGVLMINAGIRLRSGMFDPAANWELVLGVNLWGVIHGTQIFLPDMIWRGRPGLVINTGSKQGITTPPGDPAYDVARQSVVGRSKFSPRDPVQLQRQLPRVMVVRVRAPDGLCQGSWIARLSSCASHQSRFEPDAQAHSLPSGGRAWPLG
ncbi:SDR family NAD(P)-dependent oxidoreductase [Paraburkholderia sp. SIMBA_054]|uniref:SDR family NAD(P)-dependent oxidoreductase n=1 Tax=Paraburkholderia sp. SIMBA_054 TaxID=3085795 RepID=UPI0039797114